MDKELDTAADHYDEAVSAGRHFIQDRWRHLSENTKAWLVKSGCYSTHGLAVPSVSTRDSEQLERLLYDLGTLALCAKTSLPLRGLAGAPIAREALENEVLSVAGSMLLAPRSREPMFLRLALEGVKQHQLAWLLTRLPARHDSAVAHLAFAMLCILLVLASPAMLAFALVEAMHYDLPGAIMGFYGVGLAVLLARTAKRLEERESTPDEIAYDGWFRMNSLDGPWAGLGAGAAAKLIQMAAKGVAIPPVALDLCFALALTGVDAGDRKKVQTDAVADQQPA